MEGANADVLEAIALAVGVSLLIATAIEVRTQHRLRRSGIRAVGTVVRHELKQDGDGGIGEFPVVAFADAAGVDRECRSVKSGTRKWPIGRPVPVVYLPELPVKARIDLRSHRFISIFALMTPGLAFSVLAVVLMAR